MLIKIKERLVKIDYGEWLLSSRSAVYGVGFTYLSLNVEQCATLITRNVPSSPCLGNARVLTKFSDP